MESDSRLLVVLLVVNRRVRWRGSRRLGIGVRLLEVQLAAVATGRWCRRERDGLHALGLYWSRLPRLEKDGQEWIIRYEHVATHRTPLGPRSSIVLGLVPLHCDRLLESTEHLERLAMVEIADMGNHCFAGHAAQEQVDNHPVSFTDWHRGRLRDSAGHGARTFWEAAPVSTVRLLEPWLLVRLAPGNASDNRQLRVASDDFRRHLATLDEPRAEQDEGIRRPALVFGEHLSLGSGAGASAVGRATGVGTSIVSDSELTAVGVVPHGEYDLLGLRGGWGRRLSAGHDGDTRNGKVRKRLERGTKLGAQYGRLPFLIRQRPCCYVSFALVPNRAFRQTSRTLWKPYGAISWKRGVDLELGEDLARGSPIDLCCPMDAKGKYENG